MKVGINVSNLHSLSKKRGIGYYSENLVKALRKYTNIEVVLIEGKDTPKVDVEHFPFFDLFNLTLPVRKNNKVVVTVHDVIPLVFPEHFPPGIKGKAKNLVQKLSLKNVKAVITDSESSKKDIIKYLRVSNDKVFPVYLAQADYFRVKNKEEILKTRVKYDLPERFALFVGSVNWNKNINSIAKACINQGIDLVLVGKDFLGKENVYHPELRDYKYFMENYSNNALIHSVGFVENEELVDIYNLAEVLMQPSYYEGFGLPILEGQACGVPVITGDVSSLPEVAGDGAILVDPKSNEDIEKALKEIISSKGKRESLVKKGFENIKRFSWEKTAKETEKVYEIVSKM